MASFGAYALLIYSIVALAICRNEAAVIVSVTVLN